MAQPPFQNPKMGEEACSIISQLQTATPEALNTDSAARFQTLELAKSLVASLENPVSKAVETVFRPSLTVVARIAVDLDLFTLIRDHGKPITSAELAEKSGGEERLISRILRLLAAASFVDEDSANTWSPTPVTRAMALPGIMAGHRFAFDILVKSFVQAPKYLAEMGWKCPTEPHDGLVQYANQTKLNVWDFMQQRPSLFKDFNTFMGSTLGIRKTWEQWFDIPGRLLSGYDKGKGEVLLVDVGGGKGHDLQLFHTKFAGDYSGDLILQDMQSVISSLPPDTPNPSIKRQAHDFFTPQPIIGARAYFLHHILHDWSDPFCHKILANLRTAMTPGYSKLIIHEVVMPDAGAKELHCRLDMAMMTFNAGMERSRQQWRELVEAAGFAVLGMWGWEDGDGILECEVPVHISNGTGA